MTTNLFLLLLFACAFTTFSNPSTCRGRCGEGYYRGSLCQCDQDCMGLNECCTDFVDLCTTNDSCKGRCGEPFNRGNPCHCDNDCVSYNQCCPDYENTCLIEETSNEDMTNEEWTGEIDEFMILKDESISTPSTGLDASSMFPVDGSVTQQPTPSTQEKTSTAPTEGPTSTAPTEGPTSTAPTEGPTSTAPTEGPTSTTPKEGLKNVVPTEGPTIVTPSEGPANVPTEGSTSTEPSEGSTRAEPPKHLTSLAPSEGPTSTTLTEVPGRVALADGSTVIPSSSEPTTESSFNDPGVTPVSKKPTKKPNEPSTDKNDKSESKDPTGISTNRPGEKPLKPSLEINGKTESIKDYQADDYDTNLCSGRPVSGLTTLRNGTVVVFRGHYFWTLDKHRNPDPPQLITRVWGIPSPIDTVYTRCNCEGKTYFFKGKNYWRFENGVMDPGFPKPISQGFGQIGHITAALSIPEYRSRKESVIFFRRGGMAQKYTYQITPNCGRQTIIPVVTVKMRAKRQAAAALGQVISISKTWRGFPTVVTAAVSVPSRVREGYKYYVFSPRNYYSMKMEREKPVILKSATGLKENSATSFFKCKN